MDDGDCGGADDCENEAPRGCVIVGRSTSGGTTANGRAGDGAGEECVCDMLGMAANIMEAC